MRYEECELRLKNTCFRWLITGVAGFIGSNILERLLELDQEVIGIDNFATGLPSNLDDIRSEVGENKWKKFTFIEGDVAQTVIREKLDGKIDHVLHQAALGSVPRSIDNPIATNLSNVNGFLNVLDIARNLEVDSFTYASSSAVYGDHPDLPKIENKMGRLLSPYALTKKVNELYAEVYCRNFGMSSVGLRYFNVFGKRQRADGAYAAVIPKWLDKLATDREIEIYGDGSTSRDFCYIENVVQANILSALNQPKNRSLCLNIAIGDNTSLIQVFEMLKSIVNERGIQYNKLPNYLDFRAGDVKHSTADTTAAMIEIEYSPSIRIREGLNLFVDWYLADELPQILHWD